MAGSHSSLENRWTMPRGVMLTPPALTFCAAGGGWQVGARVGARQARRPASTGPQLLTHASAAWHRMAQGYDAA